MCKIVSFHFHFHFRDGARKAVAKVKCSQPYSFEFPYFVGTTNE